MNSIINQKFGKLTVIDKAVIHAENEKRFRYICKCECGRETYARKDHLIAGRTTCCGKCDGDKFHGKTLRELAEISGLSYTAIIYRLKKGMSYDEVIAPKTPRYENCGSKKGPEDSPIDIPYYWQL